MITRVDVVAAARAWLGTPFHHQARLKGVGVDCAGLLIGVGRELGIFAAEFDVPPYLPTPDGHSLLAACDRYMDGIDRDAMRPGDVLVMRVDVDPQHLGIVGDYRYGGLSLIHASNQRGVTAVIETRLVWSRRQRFVAAYQFRGVA